MIVYSIIIPTCHKDLAERCLTYLAKINKPQADYEVLVIHNTSQDDVKSVVENYKSNIPDLRYIYENNYGLMASRHRGAKEAQGNILCFLDDDSFVDKNWLIAIEDTFENRDIVIAGGNNLPLYDTPPPPPKWLKYFWRDTLYGKMLPDLSLINFRNRARQVPAWFVFGCNFIIRKDVFFKFGGTNPDIVPKDKQRWQGDGETALSLKLNKEGYAAFFNPQIKIQHFVPRQRMSVEYLKKRYFYQGVGDSFSKIRKEHGLVYYDFTFCQAGNKESVKLPKFLLRIYDKIVYEKGRLLKRLEQKNKNYIAYLEIKRECDKACQEGFAWHQNEVKNDSDLLKWVLK
ncbi:glycosyl transferase GTA-type super family, partial [Candidatus Termititenax aidoneus]